MSKLHVLAVHGMGYRTGTGFSRPLEQAVRARLQTELAGRQIKQAEIQWFPVDWSHIADPIEEELFTSVGRRAGIFGLRRFMVFHMGDNLLYLSAIGAQARERLGTEVSKIREHHRGSGEEAIYITMVAHSLGSVIAFDYLHEQCYEPEAMGGAAKEATEDGQIMPGDAGHGLPAVRLSALFTLGSPLALFQQLTRAEDPAGYLHYHFRRPGVAQPIPPFFYRPGGTWCNALDEDDYFAYPLESLAKGVSHPRTQKPFVTDVRVNICGLPLPRQLHFLCRLIPQPLIAHTGYWASPAVANLVATQLQNEWQELNAEEA